MRFLLSEVGEDGRLRVRSCVVTTSLGTDVVRLCDVTVGIAWRWRTDFCSQGSACAPAIQHTGMNHRSSYALTDKLREYYIELRQALPPSQTSSTHLSNHHTMLHATEFQYLSWNPAKAAKATNRSAKPAKPSPDPQHAGSSNIPAEPSTTSQSEPPATLATKAVELTPRLADQPASEPTSKGFVFLLCREKSLPFNVDYSRLPGDFTPG